RATARSRCRKVVSGFSRTGCSVRLQADPESAMKTTMLVVTAFVLATAMPLRAHHAFGGEFDANRPVLLKGSVVKVEWVNPHAWIHIAVKQPDGKTDVWMIEGGSPNSLLRSGVTRDSLPVGTEIVVDGYQARDHSVLRANGRNITYPDGRKLLLGSSAPAAQNDPDPPTVKK